MTDSEIAHVYETHFELIEGLPSLWDNPTAGSQRAVCLIATDGRVEIHTDPEVVAAYLDGEE